MKQKVIFEYEGKRLTVGTLVLFAYVVQGVRNKRVCLTIDMFDKLKHAGTVIIDTVPSHNGYNCIRAKLSQPVIATHCYVTITQLLGIKELSDVYAVGTAGAVT